VDYKRRLNAARRQLDPHRIDALLITHLPNVRYLCGFTGSSGILALDDQRSAFFTDGRYTQQARDEVRGAHVRIDSKALKAATEWLSRRRSLRRIGIESAHVTVAEQNAIRKLVPTGCKLAAMPPLVEQLRIIKDSEEIARIRSACHLGVKLFDSVLRVIRAGVEESDIAAKLEYEAHRSGAEQMAFSSIIAGGKRSALPHGRASHALIPRRGFVVCDFGVILAGYCSDMTRTLHVGVPARRLRDGYAAVRDAQQAAVEAVRPGVSVGEVDEAARKLLAKRKLARFFSHSTGHGVGLEIHEVPRIAAGQKERLRPGMVITIEPGIYLPGKWGVRIEDTVLVTQTSCEILTPCPKELITV
jgi:Xaa-Pro aminopeptidase